MNVPLVQEDPAASAGCDPFAPNAASKIGNATCPGQYGQFLYLRNNTAFQFDMSINKIVRIKERWQFNSQAEAVNFLNHPFFPLGNTGPTATNFGQVTSASGTRTVQLRGSLQW